MAMILGVFRTNFIDGKRQFAYNYSVVCNILKVKEGNVLDYDRICRPMVS